MPIHPHTGYPQTQEGTPAANSLAKAAAAVVAAFRAVGRCEDEFLPEYPDACAEHREWLDTTIVALAAVLAASETGES